MTKMLEPGTRVRINTAATGAPNTWALGETTAEMPNGATGSVEFAEVEAGQPDSYMVRIDDPWRSSHCGYWAVTLEETEVLLPA